MKNVLIVTYSQSGQLDSIVDNVSVVLEGKAKIHKEKLQPNPDFRFPWKDLDFWDAMPESVDMVPSGLEPMEIDTTVDYDLIIIGYPIWFLSPPIPLTTFLKSDVARKVMNDKPVITVIGSRNMWAGAQEDIKTMIVSNGGRLVGNISLRDRHHNLPSVVTIIYWMTTGRKDRYLGIFPKPGISDADIASAKRFGQPILGALNSNDYDRLQTQLLELGSVEIIPSVLSLEKKGKKIFRIWSRAIRKKGGPGNPARKKLLIAFKWYLLTVIFVASPIATLIFYLTYPLFFIKIRRGVNYYKGVELKRKTA